MGQKDKHQKTSNSLQDLGKLTGMEKETQSKPNQEVAQNFYSFLHKRERFFKTDVVIPKKKGNTEVKHKKFEIKKINIEDAAGDRVITDFKNWQETPFYQSFITRHHNNALQLTGGNLLPKVYDNKKKNDLQFQPDWRLAIGLGSGSVFETSISLHHVYGFPYIPASAIKGITHHYALSQVQNADDLEAIKTLFGTAYDRKDFEKNPVNPAILSDKNEQGSIIFFDAYPIESPQRKIKADIMNNHYQPYYNGEAPPADYHKLNPIIFLTVEKLTFQFMVGLHKGVENTNIKLGAKSGDMLLVVTGFLKDALTEKGIGAKTAVGYGYMQ